MDERTHERNMSSNVKAEIMAWYHEKPDPV